MDFAIETVNLTKRFSPRKLLKKRIVNAVTDVSLKVSRGEMFALLGPNAAGKTTLLKLLCTLVYPTSGDAYINGHSIRDEHCVRQSIGFVTGEERSFYWRLSGRENLRFFAALYGLSPKEAMKKIDELAELLDVEGLDTRVQEYSAGMKQRLALARSLLGDPPLLLMDEPTRSLDPLNAQKLQTFVKETLCGVQGKTVLFTTHNLEEAAQLPDRIGIMNKGELKASGTIEDVGRDAGVVNASLKEILQRLTDDHQ